MKTRSLSADLLWLGVVLLVVLSIAFLLPVTPQDYWWYLRVGRDTLQAGAVPQVDNLTFTRPGTPVVYHSWGTAVLFHLLHQTGGLTLTIFLRGVLLAVTFGLCWAAARRAGAGRVETGLVLLTAGLASSNNWSIRPQLLAYPLFSLALLLILRWHSGGKKAAWWLPLICLAWVNLHGSFVMLFLLAGAALVFGRGDRRAMLVAIALSLATSLVNPRNFGAWSYVLESISNSSSRLFSSEWLPPVNTGWQMNIFFVWLLAFPLLVFASNRRPDRLDWAWFLGFGLLALSGERYVIWFLLILAVQTARMVSGLQFRYAREGKKTSTRAEGGLPFLNIFLGGMLVLLPMSLLPGVRQAWWKQAPPVTENTPISAVEWLRGQPDLSEPLWSEIGFSSYLEYALPERPTWIDTRFEVFPVEQWEQYRDISAGVENWDVLLNNSGAGLALVSVQTQPRLLAALEASPRWCELYRDEVAVFFQYTACGGR